MIVLIPAYEPDEQLVELVRSIRALRSSQQILVVDDGSGPEYREVFRACCDAGCELVTHPVNRGKGAALKTGFAHIAQDHPDHEVVCADCDGQHTTTDILKVADAVAGRRDTIVLGARSLGPDVPLRSRFGNAVTRVVFRRITGIRIHDTQTGLRGYPASMLVWLQSLKGERFEYELETLLQARRAGFLCHEVPIATVYLTGDHASHFRPVIDSIRVYAPFFRFATSSLAAAWTARTTRAHRDHT